MGVRHSLTSNSVLRVCLLALVCAHASAQEKSRFQEFERWIAGQIRQLRSTLEALSRVRGERSAEGRDGERRLRGDSIFEFDTKSRRETLLSECPRLCWSPAVDGNGGVFFLDEDGVWSVAKKTAPIARLRDASEILGFIDARPGEVFLLMRTQSPDCVYKLVTIDLKTGQQSAPPGAPMTCFASRAGIPKAGWVNGGRILDYTDEDKRQLLIGRVADPVKGIVSYQPLIPEFENERPKRSRFDAVWRSDMSVVYLRRSPDPL
jgi:hypothetical protein